MIGIELRDRSQHRLRVDQIADLGRGLSGDAGDQRANLGEAKVEFCVLNSRFRGSDRRLCRFDRGFALRLLLSIVIELALRNGVSLRERGVAIDIDFGEA